MNENTKFSLKEIIEKYPNVLNETVEIVSAFGFGTNDLKIVLQFVGDGNYRTKPLSRGKFSL